MSYNPKGFNIPESTDLASSAFGFDFHQVAMYTSNPAGAVECMRLLGFDEWFSDSAILEGQWRGMNCKVHALMHFNYQMLNGKELEFVQYFMHPDQEAYNMGGPFISHVSAYVDDIDNAVGYVYDEFRMSPFHRFETSGHTNPRVAGKKHFREAIFETPALGFNIKLIEKVIE